MSSLTFARGNDSVAGIRSGITNCVGRRVRSAGREGSALKRGLINIVGRAVLEGNTDIEGNGI
jgi:hypothetical protein